MIDQQNQTIVEQLDAILRSKVLTNRVLEIERARQNVATFQFLAGATLPMTGAGADDLLQLESRVKELEANLKAATATVEATESEWREAADPVERAGVQERRRIAKSEAAEIDNELTKTRLTLRNLKDWQHRMTAMYNGLIEVAKVAESEFVEAVQQAILKQYKKPEVK